jgi:hypothetical protein
MGYKKFDRADQMALQVMHLFRAHLVYNLSFLNKITGLLRRKSGKVNWSFHMCVLMYSAVLNKQWPVQI